MNITDKLQEEAKLIQELEIEPHLFVFERNGVYRVLTDEEATNLKQDLESNGWLFEKAVNAKYFIENRLNLKRELLEEIEIQQGKDGEPRYILTQKQFDKL